MNVLTTAFISGQNDDGDDVDDDVVDDDDADDDDGDDDALVLRFERSVKVSAGRRRQ